MRRIGLLLTLCLAQLGWADTPVDLVRVQKSAHTLQLLSQGQVVRTFHVALGSHPQGQKQQEGDGRTPEGAYVLDYKKDDSAFYKAIHLSYPNAQDIAAAQQRGVSPGGLIMIHGQKNGLGWLAGLSQKFDWTNGCIALSNVDMDVVWQLVAAGTPIEVQP